jgi:hypothetical protein
MPQRHLCRWGIMLCVVLEMAAGEVDRLQGRISGRFRRPEPRARVRAYVSGLVARLERKNGWTLAEQAGELSPDGDAAAAAPDGLGRGRGPR